MERTISLPDDLFAQVKGTAAGYSEADVADVIKQWRREQRGV